MSRHTPGTKDWWVETGLIALGGVALALWLWDGVPESATVQQTRLPDLAHEPRTLGDLVDGGCLTADHLAALRDGRSFTVHGCGNPYTASPFDEPRPFP